MLVCVCLCLLAVCVSVRVFVRVVCAYVFAWVSGRVSACLCAGRTLCLRKAITRLLLDIVGVAENNGLKLPREFGMLIK